MMQDKKDNVKYLISNLEKKGIKVWEENGKLKYRSPQGAASKEDLQSLKENKEAIICFLQSETKEFVVEAYPENRHQPFPLTDIQSAYLLGRNDAFGYGGVACHIYLEIDYDNLDNEICGNIWNQLILRHDMLRATIDKNGYQQVLESVPKFKTSYFDMSRLSESEIENELGIIRENMGHRVYDTETWPLFDVAITKTPTNSVLHFSIEFLIADWASIWLLLSEFENLYYNPQKELHKLNLNFRDYLIAEKRLKESITYYNDKEYWMKRVDTLPSAPNLPLSNNEKLEKKPTFKRHTVLMDNEKWKCFKEKAKRYGITPTVAVMSAYASVIERWSSSEKFCLNLTVLNRLPLHKEVNDIVGDFTSISLLNIDWTYKDSFCNNARRIGGQLFDDLDHRLFSGVEVLREISRRRGREAALMPYVFTSAIGLIKSSEGSQLKGTISKHGISQTPQVFIDCQAMDTDLGLQVNWDVRDGIFADDMIDDMFNAFEMLLNSLSSEEMEWQKNENITLPKWQLKQREAMNNTKKVFSKHLLHSEILKQIKVNPNKVAIIDSERSVTYEELGFKASAISEKLKEMGCNIKDNVAIIMDKSIHQVESALGVLSVGGVYVPIDTMQPEMRRMEMLIKTETKFVLTLSSVELDLPREIIRIDVDKLKAHCKNTLEDKGEIEAPSYIIHTSGSTGVPKGVVITHEAAVNTIEDINQRFNIKSSDVALGLAQLSFDLSVYDIFGILSVGGTLIYPSKDRQTDPSHWADLMVKHGVTVWNSVPALMQMLVTYLDLEGNIELPKLKLAMLSGDWIPLNLPDMLMKKAQNVKVVSLGGATEASIWSIFYEYKGLKKSWKSIPYGSPLANQGFRILDKHMRDCPVWVTGELFISGQGLAKEYYGSKEITESSFIYDPITKERLYRTGDMGRYTKKDEIEFLGREDNQVKIKGHRIELGEIEAALQAHKSVSNAAVVVIGKDNERSLFAVVEQSNNEKIVMEELIEFISNRLPSHMVPKFIEVVDSMPLTNNDKVDRNLIKTWKVKEDNSIKFNRKTLESDPLSKLLAQTWEEALGINNMDENRSFYEYGADSLIMAQVTGKLRGILAKSPYNLNIQFDVLLRNMLNNPTLYELSEFIHSKDNRDGKDINKIDIDENNEGSTNANIIFYGDREKEPVRVVFHEGLGSMSCFKHLIPHLINQNQGSVIGINIDDADVYSSLDAESVIETIAEDYANRLIKMGYKSMQLIGYSLGGTIAVEVARRIVEQGIDVVDLVLIDPHNVPLTIEDELILEVLFISNFNLTMKKVGFDWVDEWKMLLGLAKLIEINKGKISKESILQNSGDENIEKAKEFFKLLSKIPKKERLKKYSEAASRCNGEEIPFEMIERLFKIFCQSYKAAQFKPMPYFGDVRMVLSEEPFPLLPEINEITEKLWREVCLGNISIKKNDGNHFTCIATEPNATNLAKEIGAIFIK